MMGSEYSNLKLFYHTDRIEMLKNGERCAPIYVRLKPTNRCNQHCYYCFYDNNNSHNNNVYSERYVNRTQEIPWDKMQEIINDFAEMGVKAVTFSGGGDPLCYPYIVETVNKLKENNIDYALITNGQALSGEKAEVFKDAKWVRVSIESTNQETYRKIRGVSTYESVMKNIQNFSKIKNKNCALGVNCVVNEHNYKEIYELCKIVKNAGVGNIKFSPVNDGLDIVDNNQSIRSCVSEQIKKAINELSDENFTIVDKYSTDIEKREDYNKEYSYCWTRELFTIIAADQNVYNCIDKAYIESGKVGSIENQSFKEMWFSDKTTNKFRTYDIAKECNFRCIYDDRNKILNDVLSLDTNHVNFI